MNPHVDFHALAPEIVKAVRERRVPDVLIVGHTDTTGSRAMNFDLGLRRANTVRALLRQAGLDGSAIDVVSHGETELLVRTCHKRGAFAIGGMAAFIPTKNPETNEKAMAKVHEDKKREATDGFDGSWVAHPGLVPICFEEFDAVLGEKPNQIDRKREEVSVTADDLLNVKATPGEKTIEGLRAAVDVGVRYIVSWLGGNGAAAIHNLMEDAATAEISRSQIWQWLHNDVVLAGGEQVTKDLVRNVIADTEKALRSEEGFPVENLGRAVELFERVAVADEFVDFLTLSAYERLP